MKLFSLYCVRRLNIKINNNVSLQGQGDFEYVHVVLVLLRLLLTQLLKGLDCCSNQTKSFHPVKDEQLLGYDYT